MRILFKQAKIIDPAGPLHTQTKDILMDISGKIIQISDQIETGDAQAVELPKLHVARGWIDMK